MPEEKTVASLLSLFVSPVVFITLRKGRRRLPRHHEESIKGTNVSCCQQKATSNCPAKVEGAFREEAEGCAGQGGAAAGGRPVGQRSRTGRPTSGPIGHSPARPAPLRSDP